MKSRFFSLLFFAGMTSLLVPACLFSQVVIGTGGHLVLNGTVRVVLNNGGLTNNGNLHAGSSYFIFSGSAATNNTLIDGVGTSSFYNLVLNKSSNGIQLNTDIAVTNLLQLQSGDSLFLNMHHIDLGSTGTLSGESNTRRITGRTGGYIRALADLNQPVSANPGQLGIGITSPLNLGLTEIRRGHNQQSGSSVFRYFDIEPTNINPAGATIRFYYWDAELAGISEANLGLFGSQDDGIHWVNFGEQQLDNGLNFVEQSGINSLDRFTLSNISAPLPLRLIYFRANRIKGQVNLNWACEEEGGTVWYEPERSSDGVHFVQAGRIPAAGSGRPEQFYSFKDTVQGSYSLFYRLKITDADGQPRYSPVVKINGSSPAEPTLQVYPNPANGSCRIIYVSRQQNQTTLRVFDQQGKVVINQKVNYVEGMNIIPLDLEPLPAGIYYLDAGLEKRGLTRIVRQ
ncbi:MAG: T9SS type A sorting domain-containing protein [Bacteroidetes bacterium]|nr:T9SS type A sorting domain-containing protein [Bacteroidota bacterium]